jgi:hypothetical protein
MKQVKSKDSAQEAEPCSREFWEDDCGLSELATDAFAQIRRDAKESDEREKE